MEGHASISPEVIARYALRMAELRLGRVDVVVDGVGAVRA